MKKILYLSVLCIFLLLAGCDGNSQTEEHTSDRVQSEQSTQEETDASTTKVTEVTETTETTETEDNAVLELIDFIVNVPEGREPVILQLTDMQIIDASQERTADRLGSTHDDYWGADKKDVRCYDYLREIIDATAPDLILITGDLVYGEFDDNGKSLLELIEFMESYKIPWAPVFGNHENETKMGVDWQCEQLEKAEHCLFLQRKLTGNGNYTVGIEQGGKITRVFFMLDSNGCGAASAESMANGHTKTSPGFGSDQIKWYKKTAQEITKRSPDTKLSFAFHIQLSVFGDAFAKYNTDGSTSHVYIDQLDGKQDGDFGYIGAAMKSPWDGDRSVWNGLKALGVDSVFVGHEHANSASIVYDGVRLQYGMKCSTYDRLNYVSANGDIESSYYSTNTPWVGGSVFSLADDGSIKDPYIYYCKDAGGEIDWDSFKKPEDLSVNGLQKGVDLTLQSGISMTGVQFDENITAYEVVASEQGKVYVNVSLLKNKSKFTFTVFVPEESKVKLNGYGEFAIRTKPNEIEPAGDGAVQGYIDYNSSSANEDYRLKFGEWQTFTVDISSFGEGCTEFAFVIAKGNTVYLRDLTIE
ncbi:MAG: metallophosphoesterase [Clostridia bacterium]|nr:metallophosphoesterase [Clostridia bacterium]